MTAQVPLVRMNLDGVATADDVDGLRTEIAELRGVLEKLVEKLTVREGGDRKLRTEVDAERHAFRMRQFRAAKLLGFTVSEFRERFGDVDSIPRGAPSKASEGNRRKARR